MKGTLLYVTIYVVVISILVGIFFLKNASKKKALKKRIAQLEKELGFGNGTIAKWDISQPRTNKIAAVAFYFNVPLDSLTATEKENPATVSRDEVGKYAYIVDLLERSSPEAVDEAVALLISRLRNQ